MKILPPLWFTEQGSPRPIGIVIVEADDDTVQAFIGTGSGISEATDIEKIIRYGASFSKEAALHLWTLFGYG